MICALFRSKTYQSGDAYGEMTPWIDEKAKITAIQRNSPTPQSFFFEIPDNNIRS